MPDSYTSEHVAYLLLLGIAHQEGKEVFGNPLQINADRNWMLDRYAECIDVVRNPNARLVDIKKRP